MKKIYLLMMFALLGMVANAAEVVTTSTFQNGSSGVNINSDNLTWSINKELSYLGYLAEKGVQFGKDKSPAGEFTLQTAETFTNVKKVEVYLSVAKSGGANISTFVGETQLGVTTDFSNTTSEVYTFEGDPVSGNILFELKSTKEKALYVQKVVIYSEEADPTQVATPTFSVKAGTYYSAQAIELSCATADASIFYTINDGVETAYEAPIELNESGEYTIKAWATKDGLDNSEIVTQAYSLQIGVQPMTVELNIADYCNTNGILDGATLYSIDYNNVKFSATKGTVVPKLWSDNWRIYKSGGSLTITAPEGYFIESLDFVGALDFNELSGNSWVATTNTQEVVFTCKDRTDITSITVNLKENNSNQVATPTFSLTPGTYEGTQSLTLNCETEGATIYYTMNGGEPQTYADAIELTEGEYAFVAWAEKDGMTKSSEVTANYTIVAPLVANNIAEFLALGAKYTDREITLNCDLTVTYQGSTKEGNTTRDLYVQDKDGKGLLIFNFDNPQLKKGDVISGVKGKYDFYNGVPELIEPVLGEVKETVEVAPVSVDASQLTVDNVNDYVVINNVELSEVNGANATLNDETATLALYNKYNACTYPEELNKKYFVTGIVSVYKDAVQIYPLEITVDTESGVNDAVANEFKAVAVANGIEVNVAEAGLVSVYNAAGQLVANVNVAEGATTINVASGFYIVKAGNNVAKVLVK